MASSRSDAPVLLIIGGPNGSGKSSAYTDALTKLEGRTIWIVNPDLLTVAIRDAEGMPQQEANLAAVQRLEAWAESSLRVHKSIGLETVLSTDKYRRLVTLAKALGFEFWLIYVMLDTPERNVERVRLRVLKGGHDVPEDAVHRRFHRSLDQLDWFLAEADMATIYDNSGDQPRVVGEKRDGGIRLHPGAPQALFRALIGPPIE